MAIFSFENGNLVPAQSVDLSVSRLGEETLTALRTRALELIDEPLFPIAWTSEESPSGERESLIALDPSGQIVTVDVLARLSGEELISTLGSAGRHSDTSAEALASMKGVSRADFEREWEAFLDVCPPVPRSGPRLYLIVLAVEDEVRSAIEALAGAAVSVRLASVVGSGSQVFISVDEMRPRMTLLSSLLESARTRAQVTSSPMTVDAISDDESHGEPVEPVDTAVREWVQPAAEPVVEPESISSPVTVSLYADSLESAAAVDDGEDVDAGDEVVGGEDEVAEENPLVDEIPEADGSANAGDNRFETGSIFPSRRTLRMEREQNDTEQGVERPTANRSVFSFSSLTTGRSSEQSEKQTDNSNLTLSTFDISDRPPTPAQAPQSDSPTAPAPESALSVESTVSVQSARSVDSAPSAGLAAELADELADEHLGVLPEKKLDEESRAKAIFASLPRFFSKASAEKRRAEQLLWEQAAPSREGRGQALLSESTADSQSSNAVAQAAKQGF